MNEDKNSAAPTPETAARHFKMRPWKRKAETAESQAITDHLTGLPNRRAFDKYANELIHLANRNMLKTEPTFFYFDLDNFKQVNDNLGHQVGDELLVKLAELLSKDIRESDQLSRWGGDEFALLSLTLVTKTISDKIKDGCDEANAWLAEKHPTKDGKVIAIMPSIGVAEYRQGMSFDNFVKEADGLMYKAKRAGGNRVAYRHTQGEIKTYLLSEK